MRHQMLGDQLLQRHLQMRTRHHQPPTTASAARDDPDDTSNSPVTAAVINDRFRSSSRPIRRSTVAFKVSPRYLLV